MNERERISVGSPRADCSRCFNEGEVRVASIPLSSFSSDEGSVELCLHCLLDAIRAIGTSDA